MDGTNRNEGGFTLLEALITISIVASIALIAAPNLSKLLEKNKVETAKSHIKRATYLARTEAIMRGESVYLCLTEDGKSCSNQKPSRVMVFTDPNYQGERSSQSKLLMNFSWDNKNIRVTYNRSLLKFTPRGYASGTNGTFTICSSSKATQDGLVISTLGRARSVEDYNRDGIPDKAPGIPLTCQ